MTVARPGTRNSGPGHIFLNQSPIGKTKIDHSKNYIIGSPGFGRDEGDFIEDNMVYCMGGTGMIFSNQLIRSIRRVFNLILIGLQCPSCLGIPDSDLI